MKEFPSEEARLTAYIKAVVALVLLGVVAYSCITQVVLGEWVVELVFLVLGVYFGWSAQRAYKNSK
jgi:undecaprenyl pyrophosphate phosphatase UppP